MLHDILAALFLLAASAALTWRETILKHEAKTWPPTPEWLMWIIYVIVCIQVTLAVFVGYRAVDGGDTHVGAGAVALLLAWASYQVGMLSNTLTYAKDHKMAGLLSLFERRRFEVRRLPADAVPRGVNPRDAVSAVEAVSELKAAGWKTAGPGAGVDDLFPRGPK